MLCKFHTARYLYIFLQANFRNLKKRGESVEKYLRALSGISYKDWKKLRIAIDRVFQNKIRETEEELKITDLQEITNLIQSQFG